MRQSKIELLRFLCALGVIFFHVGGIEELWPSWLYVVFSPFAEVPIPIFIIITGYMSFNNKKNRGVYYLITCFYYYLLFLLLETLINIENENFVFTNLLTGGSRWWYLWSMIPIYFVGPFYNIISKTFSKYQLLFFIVILLSVFYLTSEIKYSFPPSLGNFVYLSCGYLIGNWLNRYEKDIKIFIKLWFSYIYIISMLIIEIIIFATIKYVDDSPIGPHVLILAISIFTIFNNFKIKNNKFINFLGSLSLSFYLFHYSLFEVILIYLDNYINTYDRNLLLIIYFFITTLSTFIFSIIIIFPINLLIKNTNKLYNFIYSFIYEKISNKMKKVKIDNNN
ncbi:acyltransferase family protein [Spiroplasma turonicum]|uniref:Acyltransferase 3 domain-containing protein n=1 Tax=Spiroplasma turonicum TaxID=216946 RepID=A0A0K1P6M4_9MOLU|nr:acyltransferase [Spiroplasma turonicum]AKU79958.1 hypothetical protein STURON_00712 [Spiroplasma turonicum]ALX70971.1 hypothetical protein STURO_v1c07120 [Spiroplasma turonicum]